MRRNVARSPQAAADERIRALFRYYRACFRREDGLDGLIDLSVAPNTRWSALPSGPETLFTGSGIAADAGGEAEAVLHAASEGRLRYGYPLIVLAGEADADDGGPFPRTRTGGRVGVADSAFEPDSESSGSERVRSTARHCEDSALARLAGLGGPGGPASSAASPPRGPGAPSEPDGVGTAAARAERVWAAPLFVADVETVTSPGGPARVRLASPPEVNPALLRRLEIDGEEERAAFRTAVRGPDGPRFQGTGIASLGQKARSFLARLHIDRVDDVDPALTRGAATRGDLRPGAHNIAVLFRTGDGDRSGLAQDFGSEGRGVLAPERIGGTALEPFATRTVHERDAPVLSVSARRLPPAAHSALDSAMRRTLTVVAAPPETGASALVDAAVRTACADGQSVLVAVPEGRLPAPPTGRGGSDAAPWWRGLGGAVLAAGGPQGSDTETRVLTRLLERPAADLDHVARRQSLRDDWARARDAWAAIDAAAASGHALALIGAERRRLARDGWDPDALFTVHTGEPEYWLRRARRAQGGGFSALAHRSAVKRELGVDPTEAGLDALVRVASLEARWRGGLDRRRRAAALPDLFADLDAALACHVLSGADHVEAVAERAAARGRVAVVNRLEALDRYGSGTWHGFAHLLTAVPAWSVEVRRARALPPVPALFDLVVVAEADRMRACEVGPLLYRARRALVIGDPAQPGPPSPLDPEEDRAFRRSAGVDEREPRRWGAATGGESAHRVCSAVVESQESGGGAVLRLDENAWARPQLVRLAARHCYGGRMYPVGGDAPQDGGEHSAPPVEWRHAAGECEPAVGGSSVNREEAYRVAVLLQQLDEQLPHGARIGVMAAHQAQWSHIRRLLRRRTFAHTLVVGGPERFRSGCGTGADGGPWGALGGESVDVTVVSATGPPDTEDDGAAPSEAVWRTALTRTRSRLIIVGDREAWSRAPGIGGDLCRMTGTAGAEASEGRGEPGAVEEQGEAHRTPAVRLLLSTLRAKGAHVDVDPSLHGHGADLRVRSEAGFALVLIDQARDGAELSRLLRRARVLERLSARPVVCVPAWRCLHDPDRVATEVAAAAEGP